VSTGLAVGTASAGLLDFHPNRDAAAAGLTNGVMSAAGLGLGVLTSATVVQLLPAPRVLPYLLLVVLFASSLVGVLRMPEPVSPRARLRLTPQRPHVPRSVRRPFALAALAAASAYSIGGLFFSLGPELSGKVLATGNHVATAASLFLLTGIGSAAQLAYRRRPPWIAASSGCAALAAGVTLIALAAAAYSAPLLMAGSAVAGAGFGLAFLGALGTLSAAIPPDQRAGVMSAFFVVGYTALSAPAVGAGLAVAPVGLRATFEVFAAAVAVLALVVAVAAWRRADS
jgi:hypothetical protein